MGGTVAVNKKVYKKVWWYNHVSGYRLSPDDAYLIIRGLRTLDIRMDKHQENTKKVINFLKNQKKIFKILYPYKNLIKRIQIMEKILLRGFRVSQYNNKK